MQAYMRKMFFEVKAIKYYRLLKTACSISCDSFYPSMSMKIFPVIICFNWKFGKQITLNMQFCPTNCRVYLACFYKNINSIACSILIQ